MIAGCHTRVEARNSNVGIRLVIYVCAHRVLRLFACTLFAPRMHASKRMLRAVVHPGGPIHYQGMKVAFPLCHMQIYGKGWDH